MQSRPQPTVRGEFVPDNTSDSDIRDEVNRRTSKAGLTTKYGECRDATKVMMSVPWGEPKLNVWPRDKQGNLIQ